MRKVKSHLENSEESKEMEEDDCDCHLASEAEERKVEGVAGDHRLVEEVHAEAAREVERCC